MATWQPSLTRRGFMSWSVSLSGFYADWVTEPCCVLVCVCWLTLTPCWCCCFDLLDTRIALSVINLPHSCKTAGEPVAPFAHRHKYWPKRSLHSNQAGLLQKYPQWSANDIRPVWVKLLQTEKVLKFSLYLKRLSTSLIHFIRRQLNIQTTNVMHSLTPSTLTVTVLTNYITFLNLTLFGIWKQ